ncbi:three-prime repair exonuclease 1-like isoform X2 [Centruroides sculpturatus]|uniref:three-prime repair exonuclease 1-like isoform X2 n=1 Tax=Centruroides sculpturatus TaxID=218467 RepID=UPI000C6DC2E0|nr:three-prime repair exonuclease 1-like isoform X2 [Centruroides sculpturatus]
MASAGDVKIQTLVFFDTETTGLSHLIGKRNVQITELSLLAVDRREFESNNENIRVINKLNLFFRPSCRISSGAEKLTGLTDSLLQFQETFINSAELIKLFLKRLNKPICILAHNGNRFDFPLLRAEFNNSEMDISGFMFCADTLPAFRSILSKIHIKIESPSARNEESNQIEYLTDALTNVHLDNKCNNDKDDNIVKDNIDFLKRTPSNEICKKSADMRQISEDQKLCKTERSVRKQLLTNYPDVKQNTSVDKKTPSKTKPKVTLWLC